MEMYRYLHNIFFLPEAKRERHLLAHSFFVDLCTAYPANACSAIDCEYALAGGYFLNSVELGRRILYNRQGRRRDGGTVSYCVCLRFKNLIFVYLREKGRFQYGDLHL